jgi:signal transduction histidine kinase/integral membrane sensor domain MASE1/CheY-like chemotaxis protein
VIGGRAGARRDRTVKSTPSPLLYAVQFAGVATTYFGAAKLGLSMAFPAEQVSAVWPPTGVALAAVLLLGRRIWPAVYLGAFLANVTTNEPVGTALGIAAGNTLEALAGAWLLTSVAGFRPSFGRLRDAVALVVLAAMLSTMVSATVGVSSLCLGGVHEWRVFGSLWWIWWIGDAIGAIVVTPVFLAWASGARLPREPRRLLEAGALLVAVLAVGLIVFVFSGRPDERQIPFSLEYLLFPCLIWAALRFPPAVTATATFLAAALAIAGTTRGLGPFASDSVGDSLILLQAYMGVVAVTALLLATTMNERNVAAGHRAVGDVVTRFLAESASMAAAAPGILRAIARGLGWDVAVLWQVNRESDELRSTGDWHDPRIEAAAFVAATRETTFQRGEGLPGRVWESRRAGWLDDARELGAQRCDSAGAAGIRTAFAFPILARGEVRGILEFLGRAPRSPDDALPQLAGALGSKIGLFLERAEAEEERSRLLAREQAARAEAEGLYAETREADRRKDEFLAMLGHELRNPLAPLRNAFDLIRARKASPAVLERAAEIMGRQIANLTRLVDDLLDVSRITRGKIQLERERLDLVALVSRAVEGAKSAITSHRHELTLSMPAEPIWIEGDPMRLEQVVSNLLQNACKYTKPGGCIWLELERVNDEVVLRVRDTGIGIDPEILPHVFDLFRQADRSLDRSGGGLGIGLTLVRRLVELHGGMVSARSEGAGRGSEFVVRLPAPAPGPAAVVPAGDGAAAAAIRPSGRRILVVEDNADVAETLALLLREWGHQTLVAHDGHAALEAADRHRPDVVLLDIGLPGMDGYEVARRLRQEYGLSSALLIAVTGYGQEEDRRRSREASIDHHLVKPVDPALLARLLGGAPAGAA